MSTNLDELQYEINRNLAILTSLSENMEILDNLAIHRLIHNLRVTNDQMESTMYQYRHNSFDMMSRHSNIMRNFTSESVSHDGTFEIVTRVSTTSDVTLPDSFSNILNNLMNQHDHISTSENVVVALPQECIFEMPSKRYKRSKHSKDRQNFKDQESCLCAICRENFKHHQRYRELPCKHKFHKRCVDEWFETSVMCPMCRQDVRILLQN